MQVAPGRLLARRLVLIAGALAAAYVPLADYIASWTYPEGEPIIQRSPLLDLSPWGGSAWTEAAHGAVSSGTLAIESTDVLVLAALRRYPLDPDLWLDRAALALANNAPHDRVLTLLETARAVMPQEHQVNWHAAMLALQAGETRIAEGYLRQYLVFQPSEVSTVISVARRWLVGDDELIDRLLPPGDVYLESLLNAASQHGDLGLASIAWDRLSLSARARAPTAGPYIDLLLRENQGARAAEAWRLVEPSYRPGGLFNGDFSQPLRKRGGLDWRISEPQGVTITRINTGRTSDRAGLEIRFDGKHNVELTSPTQFVPVSPGGQYLLSGYWQGEGLTTRSLPIILIEGYRKGGVLGRVETPSIGRWPRQPFSVRIRVPQDLSVVRISVRRYSTDRFDRFIEGRLLLDGLALTPAEGPPS
jgi:hypothetical protein